MKADRGAEFSVLVVMVSCTVLFEEVGQDLVALLVYNAENQNDQKAIEVTGALEDQHRHTMVILEVTMSQYGTLTRSSAHSSDHSIGITCRHLVDTMERELNKRRYSYKEIIVF